ncbi:MAG: DUF1376 domain-containing protein [Nitratireductor sp.]|nr:DUF1376 domain-containing protein [Nitratireductor sp.]
MPLWVSDFELDTHHLSFEERGAYLSILMLMWRSPECTIPAEPDWIMRRLRCDEAMFLRLIKPILDEFCILLRGRYYQKRLKAEWLEAKEKYQARKQRSEKAHAAKALKNKKTALATSNPLAERKHASHNHNHNHMDSELSNYEMGDYGTADPQTGDNSDNVHPLEAVRRRKTP